MSHKTTLILGVIVILAIVGFIYGTSITGNITSMTGSTINDKMENTIITLETNQGNIKIELYSEKMPITAGNFESLAKKGVYDEVIFHRIIDGFMIQGGDPTGTGMGDSSIPNIQDEFTETDLDKNDRGTISMANAGPNTGSSQFFINLVNNNFLDGKHPVFGKVTEGMDVVDKIAKLPKDSQDRPLQEVKIIKAIVE